MKILSRIYVALIILFLYAPVAVMVIFSFNGSGSVWVMNGFSTRWYAGLTSDTAMMSALQHTLIIAVSSAFISTVLGTAAAVGITAIRRKMPKKIIMSVTQIPMMNADIVTGISLMLLFIFVGKLLGLSESLGFLTVLISHITFNLPYVILSVIPKLKQTDPNLPEAAMDLGARRKSVFQGNAALNFHGNYYRVHNGVHTVARRFCYKLFHLRALPDFADSDILYDEKDGKARRIRAFHPYIHNGVCAVNTL